MSIFTKPVIYLPFGVYVAISPMAPGGPYFPYSITTGEPFLLLTWMQSYFIPVNDAANYWTINLIFDTTGTIIASFNTQSYVGGTRDVINKITTFTPPNIPSGSPLSITCQSTGAPAALYLFGPLVQILRNG